jgi:ADP-ribose pyrophosphatase YjhB (NUDIX family)
MPVVSGGKQRQRCAECGWTQYRNPTVGVAVVLLEDAGLLLGRRKDGGWCIPCGHVEWDESVEQAAIREMQEETGLVVSLQGIVAVRSNFHDTENQTVGVWYRGKHEAGTLQPGDDLVEVAFFELAHLPPFKFPTDRDVVDGLRSEQPKSLHLSGSENELL